MIQDIKSLKAHIESIINIKSSIDTFIQKIVIVIDNVQDKKISQEDLFLLQSLFVELEFHLLLCKKKRYIIHYKLEKLFQKKLFCTTKLKNLQKSLKSIFNTIEKIIKEKKNAHSIYLERPEEQKKTTLLITNIQKNLDNLYKACILIQYILTLSMHDIYRQQDLSNNQYTYTKTYTIDASVKIEEKKGLIISMSV